MEGEEPFCAPEQCSCVIMHLSTCTEHSKSSLVPRTMTVFHAWVSKWTKHLTRWLCDRAFLGAPDAPFRSVWGSC